MTLSAKAEGFTRLKILLALGENMKALRPFGFIAAKRIIGRVE
jgi:hypothetical protein